MSRHTDLLRQIAAHIRADDNSCYFVVGWFAANATEEDLEHLLELLHELPRPSGQGRLFDVGRERYSGSPYDPRD
jgi:hypothetical protein